MQTTSRYASRTSASLGEGDSFIALRFGTYEFLCPENVGFALNETNVVGFVALA